MDRRSFLEMLVGTAAGVGLSRGGLSHVPPPSNPLQAPRTVAPEDLALVARPTTAETGTGRPSPVWTLDGSLPSPTIRTSRGRTATITLRNELPEETILHWHGLDVPEAADGHPRLAIPPGETYRYEFTVDDRAGTYWYHPHTHMRTAPQTYRGMAGFFIVEDEEERALGLPDGRREILLLLQDKRLDDAGRIVYEPFGPDLMLGYLGDTPFGNGVARPVVEVEPAVHRLRVLNGANARIFKLAFADGTPMTLIGGDGGLLETAARVDDLLLATAERADLLVDFAGHAPGETVTLRSLPFEIPGMMGMGMMRRGGMGRAGGGQGRGMMGGMRGPGQGAGMDLVEFRVVSPETAPADRVPPTASSGTGGGSIAATLPERLSTLEPRPVDADTPRRTFRFQSMMHDHTINGRSFELERVDLRVPLGRTKVWELVNDSALPHPVHVHSGSFRLLSRRGGRDRLLPWEAGAKDTVLVLPGERVEIAVRFARHRGLFLLHCHNLEHEDAGMMLNFEVV